MESEEERGREGWGGRGEMESGARGERHLVTERRANTEAESDDKVIQLGETSKDTRTARLAAALSERCSAAGPVSRSRGSAEGAGLSTRHPPPARSPLSAAVAAGIVAGDIPLAPSCKVQLASGRLRCATGGFRGLGSSSCQWAERRLCNRFTARSIILICQNVTSSWMEGSMSINSKASHSKRVRVSVDRFGSSPPRRAVARCSRVGGAAWGAPAGCGRRRRSRGRGEPRGDEAARAEPQVVFQHRFDARRKRSVCRSC